MRTISKRTKIIVIGAIVLVLLLLADILVFGNVSYLSKWSACGRQPYSGFGAGIGNSTVPYYAKQGYSDIKTTVYFCTPLEAEQAGYSASPDQYEFPHLTKENAG